MIGVVLWSDLDDGKAVFWCEDHGDLAYFDGSAEADDAVLLSPGDVVEFEIVLSGRIRRAQHPRVIKVRRCSDLQDQLRHTAYKTNAPSPRQFGGNVVDLLPPLSQRKQA